MDKLQLIKRIAEMHPQLKAEDAACTVKVILDALCSTLAKGKRIEIRGFGSFSLNRLPARQKTNLRTGVKLNETPRYVPRFKPAKELRARVGKDEERGAAETCQPLRTSPGRNHNPANVPEGAPAYA
jgi:integration host factor subunit beta